MHGPTLDGLPNWVDYQPLAVQLSQEMLLKGLIMLSLGYTELNIVIVYCLYLENFWGAEPLWPVSALKLSSGAIWSNSPSYKVCCCLTMLSMGKLNHIPGLTGPETYFTWKQEVTYALGTEDLWCHVSTSVDPTDILGVVSHIPAPHELDEKGMSGPGLEYANAAMTTSGNSSINPVTGLHKNQNNPDGVFCITPGCGKGDHDQPHCYHRGGRMEGQAPWQKNKKTTIAAAAITPVPSVPAAPTPPPLVATFTFGDSSIESFAGSSVTAAGFYADLACASIAELPDGHVPPHNLATFTYAAYSTILDSGTTITLVQDRKFFWSYSTAYPVVVRMANHGSLLTSGYSDCLVGLNIGRKRPLKSITAPDLTAFAHVPLMLNFWHAQMGHPGGNAMRHLPLFTKGAFITSSDPLSKCDSCILGKHPRQPYPSLDSPPASHFLKLVHLDLCGPIPTETPHGK
ncbi:hypothetical protein BDR06DRAFT_969738 [Suillus hirtellus]|nr:hypothetical protein BDR06DRAFT_969738 [Suillus hirtellus]